MTELLHDTWQRAARLVLACALALAGCAGMTDSNADNPVSAADEALALACAAKAPPEIAVPQGNRLAFRLKGVGAQVYTCNMTATGYGWVLKAPDADLFFPNGHLAGSHYAGPTWEALDGSTVVGMKLNAVTVDTSAVPWLLLQAASHAGQGMMSKVSYIQRLETTGGLAPSTGCSVDSLGAVASIDYTAEYFFYVPKPVYP
jgi:hypothetical protein